MLYIYKTSSPAINNLLTRSMKRLFFLKTLIIILFSALIISSCDEDDDPCEDCQAAINHMCEKIEDNGCNPDWMQNAVSRLREDCGTAIGNDYAGYMSHTCEYETLLDCPTCQHLDGNIVSDLSVVNVHYTILSDLPEGNFRFRLQESNENVTSLLQVSLHGPDTNVVSPYNHRNDVQIRASLESLDLNEDGSVNSIEIVTDRSERFDLYRPGKWFNPRIIRLSYDDFSEQYLIEFIDW